MFDDFDILLPQVFIGSDLEIQQTTTVFGISDDKYVYFRGIRLGRILAAKVVYSNIEYYLGSKKQAGWTVILVAPDANKYVLYDQDWHMFLDAVASILRAHGRWCVICESACDQFPRERLELSPEALITRLDSYRVNKYSRISFIAQSPGYSLPNGS